MSQPQEHTIKIIILGSSSVGKTCILQKGFENEFNQNALSTIGIDFKTKYFKFDEDKVKVNYIDTAGQEKFRAISVNYLKGTDGAVLVFDITKKETFELIGNWLDDIRENNFTLSCFCFLFSIFIRRWLFFNIFISILISFY